MGDGTSIGRVRGLGSAHEGAHHWLLQRYTAAGNFLTVIFLAVSLVALPDLTYPTVRAWLGQPVPALAVALMIVSVFWHARLGLQVMIEDYVHDAARKFAALLVLNLAAFAGAAAGLLFLTQIVVGAAGDQAAAAATKAAQDAVASALSSALGGGGPQ